MARSVLILRWCWKVTSGASEPGELAMILGNNSQSAHFLTSCLRLNTGKVQVNGEGNQQKHNPSHQVHLHQLSAGEMQLTSFFMVHYFRDVASNFHWDRFTAVALRKRPICRFPCTGTSITF
jgi:hypothetical protein